MMGGSGSGKIRRAVTYFIVFAFVLSFFVRFYLTANRRFDPDEFEHLHAAWMIHAGFLPYRDFWQNHTPLLYFSIAPIFRLIGEGIPVLFVVRTILSASSLVILWLTYRLARLEKDRLTSVLAAMVLSCSYLFLHKTIEIRPDQFLVILWLASVILLTLAIRTSYVRLWVFIAGTLLGAGMLFTPKALLCLAAGFVTIAVRGLISTRKGLLEIGKACAFYGCGFLVPIAIFAAFFYQTGALRLMAESTVLTNLSFPHGRQPTYLLSPRQIVLFLLCSAGIVISLRKRQEILPVATPMIFLIVIFLVFLPTSNPQSALVFVPMMSIYAGIAVKQSIDSCVGSPSKHSILFLVLAFSAAVVVPCLSALYEKPSTPTNKRQIERIDAILKKTRREDAFFDGNHAYVFRPQAYYYGFLVDAVRLKIQSGEVRESIQESLKKNRCKFIIYDDRVSLLSEDVQDFIRNNYIPSEIPDVYIAGKQLGAEHFSGRKARFWIELPVSYDISVSGSHLFHVDGVRYTGPLLLQPGAHVIVSDTQLQSVSLRAEH